MTETKKQAKKATKTAKPVEKAAKPKTEKKKELVKKKEKVGIKEAKKEKVEKAEKKEKPKAGPKAEKKQPKKAEKPKPKAKAKKSKEIKAISEKIKAKKKRLFRGRFGNRSIRRISNKKWQRWRKPRGIDIYFKQEDGLYPKTGFRTAKQIRGRHPSGFAEVLVRNERELEEASKLKDTAIRLSASLGKKKKITLVEKADKLGVIILNR